MTFFPLLESMRHLPLFLLPSLLLGCNALVGIHEVSLDEGSSGASGSGSSSGSSGQGGSSTQGGSSGSSGHGGAGQGGAGTGGDAGSGGGAGSGGTGGTSAGVGGSIAGEAGAGGDGESGAGGEGGTAGGGGASGAQGGDGGASGAGTAGDGGTAGDAGAGGDGGAGGDAGAAGEAGVSGTSGQGGASQGGAGQGGAGNGGGQGGSSGTSGQGGAGQGGAGSGGAGQGGAAGQGGTGGSSQGGAGQSGSGGSGGTSGSGGSGGSSGGPGYVVTSVTLGYTGTSLKGSGSKGFHSPIRSYGTTGIRYVVSGSELYRFGVQGENPPGVEIGFAPLSFHGQPDTPTWLSMSPDRTTLFVTGPSRTAGMLRVLTTDGFSTPATADTEYKDGSGAPLTATEARTAEVHPSGQFLYAILSKDSGSQQSQVVGLKLANGSDLQPLQALPIGAEGATSLIIRGDGGALYTFDSPAGGIQRFDIDQNGLMTAGKTFQGEATLHQGAVCRLNGIDQVYAPVYKAPGSNLKNGGLLHVSFPDSGNPSLTKKYAESVSFPGLASVRHLVANASCTALFVGGNALENGKYRPTVHVFAIHQQTGSLALRATYQDDTSGVTIALDAPPLLSLNPSEKTLYVVGEGSPRFLSLGIDAVGVPGSGPAAPPQFVVGPAPNESQEITIAVQATTPSVYEHCPPGELLTAIGGTADTNPNGPYGETISKLWIRCTRFGLTATTPPQLDLSPGYRSAAHFTHPTGVPWENACKSGDVMVGIHAWGKEDKSSLGRVTRLVALCAPVSLIQGDPNSLSIDFAKKYEVSTDPIPGGSPITGITAGGDPVLLGECFNSLGLGLQADSLFTGGAVPDNVYIRCGTPVIQEAKDGCTKDSECTAPAEACRYARCVDGACLTEQRGTGWPTASQSDSSCFFDRCRGDGKPTPDPLPLQPNAGECWSCDENSGLWSLSSAGQSCSAAGQICSPQGACVGAWP